MLVGQMKKLFAMSHLFIYSGTVYEKIDEFASWKSGEPKYRMVFDDDDYDYVENNPELEAQLDQRVKELKTQQLKDVVDKAVI